MNSYNQVTAASRLVQPRPHGDRSDDLCHVPEIAETSTSVSREREGVRDRWTPDIYGFGWLRLLIRESVPPRNLISVSRTPAPPTPLCFLSPARRCPSRYPVNTPRGSPLTGTDLGLRRQVVRRTRASPRQTWQAFTNPFPLAGSVFFHLPPRLDAPRRPI